jgi:hypothetical protein
MVFDGPKGTERTIGTLFGLWPDRTNRDALIAAARFAQYLAFYLSFSFALSVVLRYGSGGGLIGYMAEDVIALIVLDVVFVFLAVAFWWLGLRVRAGRLGAVPVVCGWVLIEMVARVILMIPGLGTVMSIVAGLVAVCSLRGWWLARQNAKAGIE